MPVETNIVIFKLSAAVTTAQFLDQLRARGIQALDFGPQQIRFVTHLDYTQEMADHTVQVLQELPF
jgi:threonine aldolase